jgi:hypothetical protein
MALLRFILLSLGVPLALAVFIGCSTGPTTAGNGGGSETWGCMVDTSGHRVAGAVVKLFALDTASN